MEEMTRNLQRPPGRSWPAVWGLFTVLLLGLVGLVGLGPGSLAGWAGGEDGCCEDACPSKRVAVVGEAARVDDDGSRPEEGSGEQCPPGCDDCTCCPGVAVAVAPSLPASAESPPSVAVRNPPPAESTGGVSGRIYRPPQPSVV